MKKYKKENEMCGGEKSDSCKKCSFTPPYAQLALATSPVDDKERREKYESILNDRENFTYQHDLLLQEFLALPFDAILTTNYTYEVENSFYPGFADRRKETIQEKTHTYFKKPKNENKSNEDTTPKSDRYLTQAFQKPTKNAPEIWHIHGEACRPSSMVLTHDEYARQFSAVINYVRRQKNRYQKEFENLSFQSWIDYMLMANVYIVGFSMDYAEFDLWWLLGRRMREKAKVGNIFFYAPNNTSFEISKKHRLLDELKIKIKVENLKSCLNDKTSFDYEAFYRKALDQIKKDAFSQNPPDKN